MSETHAREPKPGDCFVRFDAEPLTGGDDDDAADRIGAGYGTYIEVIGEADPRGDFPTRQFTDETPAGRDDLTCEAADFAYRLTAEQFAMARDAGCPGDEGSLFRLLRVVQLPPYRAPGRGQGTLRLIR